MLTENHSCFFLAHSKTIWSILFRIMHFQLIKEWMSLVSDTLPQFRKQCASTMQKLSFETRCHCATRGACCCHWNNVGLLTVVQWQRLFKDELLSITLFFCQFWHNAMKQAVLINIVSCLHACKMWQKTWVFKLFHAQRTVSMMCFCGFTTCLPHWSEQDKVSVHHEKDVWLGTLLWLLVTVSSWVPFETLLGQLGVPGTHAIAPVCESYQKSPGKNFVTGNAATIRAWAPGSKEVVMRPTASTIVARYSESPSMVLLQWLEPCHHFFVLLEVS